MSCIRKDVVERAIIDNLPENFDPVKENIYAPHFESEVRRCYGYLYGHYDSRGGAMLILADSMLKAHRVYFNEWNDGRSDDFTLCEIAEMHSCDSILANDFIGMVEIVVIGIDIVDLVNKDIMYGDPSKEGFTDQFYPVAYKFDFVDVFDSKVLLLINKQWYNDKSNKTDIEICSHNYKFEDLNIINDGSPLSSELRYWDLGEDACGIILMIDFDYKWRGEVINAS